MTGLSFLYLFIAEDMRQIPVLSAITGYSFTQNPKKFFFFFVFFFVKLEEIDDGWLGFSGYKFVYFGIKTIGYIYSSE